MPPRGARRVHDPTELTKAHRGPPGTSAGTAPVIVGSPPPRRSRLHRYRGALAIVVVLLVVIGFGGWLYEGAHDNYVYRPGTAPLLTTSASCVFHDDLDELALPDGTPCIRLNVPASRAHAIDGKLLMVDVLVGQSSAWQFFLSKVGLLRTFYRGSQLIPNSEVVGDAPASELGCEDTEESVGATTAAPVAALSRLGYKITEHFLGAQVFEVLSGTAALRAGIDCNDLITGVDGSRIRTIQGVTSALAHKKPGETVRVTVKRTESDGKSKTLTIPVRLGSEPGHPKRAFLGIEIQDDISYSLPFDVSANVGNIGGPSDGLAITLGLLNVLSNGKVTGGHTVAVSGTIADNGAVGEVGGVAQKAVAVSRAGATLFIVPEAEVGEARSTAGPHLKVEGVTSLDQALSDLKAIGGTVPASSQPPSGRSS